MKMKKQDVLIAIRILVKLYDDEKDAAILSVMRQLLNIYHDSPSSHLRLLKDHTTEIEMNYE